MVVWRRRGAGAGAPGRGDGGGWGGVPRRWAGAGTRGLGGHVWALRANPPVRDTLALPLCPDDVLPPTWGVHCWLESSLFCPATGARPFPEKDCLLHSVCVSKGHGDSLLSSQGHRVRLRTNTPSSLRRCRGSQQTPPFPCNSSSPRTPGGGHRAGAGLVFRCSSKRLENFSIFYENLSIFPGSQKDVPPAAPHPPKPQTPPRHTLEPLKVKLADLSWRGAAAGGCAGEGPLQSPMSEKI